MVVAGGRGVLAATGGSQDGRFQRRQGESSGHSRERVSEQASVQPRFSPFRLSNV